MIALLSIQNLGAHESRTVEFDPAGPTVIRGISQSGKSLLVEAAIFVLTGKDSTGKALDPDLVRDGTKRSSVTLVTRKGATLVRTKTRTGSQTRSILLIGSASLPVSDSPAPIAGGTVRMAGAAVDQLLQVIHGFLETLAYRIE